MPEMLPDDVVRQLHGLKQAGDEWIAQCPTHDDNSPSLSLRMGDNSQLIVHCFAGCDPLEVLRSLGVEPRRSDTGEWTPNGPAIEIYDYRDEAGTLVYQVCRSADKGFSQRRPDATKKSGFAWNLQGITPLLYRLPELVAAVAAGQRVCIAEGERDVHALESIGRVATTNSGGAGKWRAHYADYFRGADVTIFADDDAPGLGHARAIAASLAGVARSYKIVAAALPHKDIRAHLAAGLGPTDVRIIPEHPDARVVVLAPDILELLAEDEEPYSWLIEGLLEEQDRLIITGSEGVGKSMWLRQLAVMAASGIHPTRFEWIDPLRVLFIDCENSKRQIKRKMLPMIEQTTKMGRQHELGSLRVLIKPEGVMLDTQEGAEWLLEVADDHKPQLLLVGPLYKLRRESSNEEVANMAVLRLLDRIRGQYGNATILEGHAGLAKGELSTRRSTRPRGSSVQLAWPEFGYGLRKPEDQIDNKNPTYLEVESWRGDRDEREWPEALSRSTSGFPFEPIALDVAQHA